MLREPDLIVNADGSIYHLCMRPEELADLVIVVGDPGRVRDISKRFSKVECSGCNREFISNTGWYNGQRITALSTGIGTDNIDIVLHELDALCNIDFQTRDRRPERRVLTIVRIGTSGAIQPDIPLNSFALTTHAAGLDNLIYYYRDWTKVTDPAMTESFLRDTGWDSNVSRPYFVPGDQGLVDLFSEGTVAGITVTAPGFYGPQGRNLSIPPADPGLIAKLQRFRYQGRRIINFEMESSALYGLGSLMGHRAVTLCALIANRATGRFNPDHSSVMEELIGMVLERITGKR